MINSHEIEEAIRQLEEGSMTYNNCMKLASLYIIRDEIKNKDYPTSYGYHYPIMYEQRGRENYNYRYNPPMYYTNDDLMIKKQGMHDMGIMR